MTRKYLNPKFRKGRDRIIEAKVRGFDHIAYAPTSVSTLTAHRHGEAIAATTSQGVQTIAFKSEASRDRFVANVAGAERAGA